MNSRKNLLILFSLIFVQACNETQNTDFDKSLSALECLSFQDTTFGIYALTHWDADSNGCLTPSEAALVTALPDNAFSGNTAIQTISDMNKFPNLTSIGRNAFAGCTNLVTANLPNVQTVGDNAFANCTNLVSVSLPNASSISENAFEGCTNLTNFIGPQTQNTCTGGALKCSDDNSQALICMNNAWMLKEPCPKGCNHGICISDTPAPACTKGTLKCSDDNTKVQLCKNNSWTTLANCPDGCTNGACITHKPAKTCAEGALKCSDDNKQVLVCANDTWLTKETCDNGCTNGVCASNEPAPTCAEGALKCSDDNKQVLVCANDTWVTKETCTHECFNSFCANAAQKGDDNRNHMNDIYETAPNQGKACRKYADCDTAPGKGDGFCDSFIGYKCSTKCTSDVQCVDDDEFHYICRPDGRCAPDTFSFVVDINDRNSVDNHALCFEADSVIDCNFTIDWGDGTPTENISSVDDLRNHSVVEEDNSEFFCHDYPSIGKYTVKIKGKYDGFKLGEMYEYGTNSPQQIVEIKSFGPVGLGIKGNGTDAFRNYFSLKSISQIDIPDALKLTSLHHACTNDYVSNEEICEQICDLNTDWDEIWYSNCYSDCHEFDHTSFCFFSLNHWDTSNVTDMSYIFYDAQTYNYPVNDWDTSNVTDMSHMFDGAKAFNQPINNWDTSNVTDMSWMFYDAASFNQPINNWDTSNVTYMSGMFEGASTFNQPINNWDTSNVTHMFDMFRGASAFNQTINNWDTSMVTSMSWMFYDASSFNQPLNNWDTSNVTDMSGMFEGASTFNQPLNNWDTSKVTNMSWMFYDASSFNQKINNWNTSMVTSMSWMFYDASSFNQPLNNWDTSNVT
ncbi:MAG: BspA family leucine-rich repeat surface protein, partial [Proteobacteria bacterium]|nr:BspA family leucine-rich repeat surface protein [Pseudomonadota bacterium]